MSDESREESWDVIQRGSQRAAPPDPKLNELCAVVFTTPSGRDLMKLLHERYVEKRQSAISPEAVLRATEAERQLILSLETARDRGLQAHAAKQQSREPAT